MIREATKKDIDSVNRVATHPLQSWEWGEFRKLTNVEVSRYLETNKNTINNVFQVTWHKIPFFDKYIGYCPKSVVPSKEVIDFLTIEGKKRGAIMIKFEPNARGIGEMEHFKKDLRFVPGKPLFTKYSFVLDINKSEEELLKGMHQKTRYNIRLAEKRGVLIVEDNSLEAFEEYWKLTEETTKRQGFYSHTKSYHQKMFNVMTKSGKGHLLKAVYKDEVITTWMIFILNNKIYYPYGASSTKHREVMANNLMMWEVIKLGKKNKCTSLDMWGSMGPEPDANDPWYGFHKFKQGYGGELVEFLGTYDLVISSIGYKFYVGAEKIRWAMLRFFKKIKL